MRLREVATSECRREELSRRGMAEMVHLQCTSALPSLPPLVDESLHTPARRGSNKSSLLSSIVAMHSPGIIQYCRGSSQTCLRFTSKPPLHLCATIDPPLPTATA